MTQIKMLKHGTEKHQLVEIDMLDIPNKVRKIYGIAKDKNQRKLFEKLGFKKEGGGFYSRFFRT